ncbi:MAG: MaoC family dehydratase N-terminal domain-containing protein [Dehalococcoidales bacterium]|nr:MaoC family dehydratase N-terminal domain-containing protein [Dehalococcoidales bacterium]
MSKDIPFNELKVGMKFGPVPFVADEKAMQNYTKEMQDANPWYLEKSPFGGPVVPPLFQGTLLGLRMIGTKFDSHTTVPAKLIQKNSRPARVGEKMTLSGTLIDKYIKRGMEYAVIESIIADENGQEIRRVTDHFLLSLEHVATPDTK